MQLDWSVWGQRDDTEVEKMMITRYRVTPGPGFQSITSGWLLPVLMLGLQGISLASLSTNVLGLRRETWESPEARAETGETC